MAWLIGALFPWADGMTLEEVHVADWGSDPYALGGYSYPVVRHLHQPVVWAAPVEDTLFFAGEATCGELHPAMVHGAIESGRRAAGEILAGARS
jgi:monoamine oxidase